jgi:hypothetical protein
MSYRKMIALAGAAALLAGCEARIGSQEEGASREGGNQAADVSAEGKAEEGKVSIKAPGFDVSINIPDAVARRAVADADSRIIPPGARFGGLHVEGARSGSAEGGHGEVELRFAVDRPPQEVAAWYRDPARAGDLTVEEARREGDAMVVSGITGRDGDRFSARIAPGSGGGSDLRLLISDRR